MQGEKEVIQQLNVALANELTSINQYFLHSRMFGNWDFSKLEEHEYEESIDEMKHADALIKRILFLEGLPNLQKLNKVRVGETPREILECDLALEMEAIPDLKDGVAMCERLGDYVSRDLFRSILADEEEHVDWLEAQLDLMTKLGEERYLAEKI